MSCAYLRKGPGRIAIAAPYAPGGRGVDLIGVRRRDGLATVVVHGAPLQRGERPAKRKPHEALRQEPEDGHRQSPPEEPEYLALRLRIGRCAREPSPHRGELRHGADAVLELGRQVSHLGGNLLQRLRTESVHPDRRRRGGRRRRRRGRRRLRDRSQCFDQRVPFPGVLQNLEGVLGFDRRQGRPGVGARRIGGLSACRRNGDAIRERKQGRRDPKRAYAASRLQAELVMLIADGT